MEECNEWLGRLYWDYTESSEIIQQVARIGNLPGFILLDGDNRPIAYCFWIQEGRRVLIGDVYIISSMRGSGLDNYIIELILHEIGRERIDRIESQNIGFGLDNATRVYQKHGFQTYQRYFMIKRLDKVRGAEPETRTWGASPRLHFRPYHSNDLAQITRLIYESYVGRPDSEINSQYSTHSGCREFFSNLISNTGCGRFLRTLSLVAEQEINKRIVGAVITTEISTGNAHLPQISVMPELQGKGLGRKMIEILSWRLSNAGYRTVSLAVSALNDPAVKLYEKSGFETLLEFPVFVKTF
ncbi:MAG TPA: GNAT family N-acetyltransferase [Blastocatellia bacterium]|nr:GNAT family N-acetyltransferase [Blastocatellia bacterium]